MKHVCLLSERIRYCHSVLINYKNPGTGRITVYYYTPIVFVRLSSGVCVLGTLLCPLQRARQSRGCRIKELDLIAPLFFMQTNSIGISVKADCIIIHETEKHHMHLSITRDLYDFRSVSVWLFLNSRVASIIQ